MISEQMATTAWGAGETFELVRKAAEGGRRIAAAGVCALIIDESDEVFYAVHAESKKYGHDTIGTNSETFQWVETPEGLVTETPYSCWMRSLEEELCIGSGEFTQAGFYFDRRGPAYISEVVMRPPREDAYSVLAATLIVRIRNPEIISFDSWVSDEILSTGFMPFDELMAVEPHRFRPGFRDWYIDGNRRFLNGQIPQNIQQLEWQKPTLTTGIDVKFENSNPA